MIVPEVLQIRVQAGLSDHRGGESDAECRRAHFKTFNL
jgi:hypothetical protein